MRFELAELFNIDDSADLVRGYEDATYNIANDDNNFIYVYDTTKIFNRSGISITDKQFSSMSLYLSTMGITLNKNGNDMEIISDHRLIIKHGYSSTAIIYENEVILITPDVCKVYTANTVYDKTIVRAFKDNKNPITWYILHLPKLLVYSEMDDNLLRKYKNKVKIIDKIVDIARDLEEDLGFIFVNEKDFKILIEEYRKAKVPEYIIEQLYKILEMVKEKCGITPLTLDVHRGNVGIDTKTDKIVLFDPVFRKVSNKRGV